MALQTTYAINPSVSYEGQIVKNGVSRPGTNRSGSALPLGRFVAIDTDSAGSDLAVDALASGDVADNVAGILTHSHVGPTSSTSGPGFLEDLKPGNILVDGEAWLYCEEAVTPADPLYVRIIANGAGKAVGQVRKSSDSSKAIAFPSARFSSVASADTLVRVSIKMP